MGARKKLIGATAAVALVLGGGFATTAEAAGAKVTKQNLPTMAQVVAVVPALDGGAFITEKLRVFDGPGKKCTESKETKAEAGRIGVYLPDFSADEVEGGFVGVHTLRFSSKAKAKQVIADVQRYGKRCSGKFYDGQKSSRLALPRIGQQRAGLSMQVREDGMQTRANMIVTRQGRTLIQVIQMADTKVAKSETVALARIALKRAR